MFPIDEIRYCITKRQFPHMSSQFEVGLPFLVDLMHTLCSGDTRSVCMGKNILRLINYQDIAGFRARFHFYNDLLRELEPTWMISFQLISSIKCTLSRTNTAGSEPKAFVASSEMICLCSRIGHGQAICIITAGSLYYIPALLIN